MSTYLHCADLYETGQCGIRAKRRRQRPSQPYRHGIRGRARRPFPEIQDVLPQRSVHTAAGVQRGKRSCITGFPARSIKSLSAHPCRSPAATTTTLQEVFLARRRKSEKRLIGLIHSVYSVCAGTDPAEPPRSHTRTIHGEGYLREQDLPRLIEHPALAGG